MTPFAGIAAATLREQARAVVDEMRAIALDALACWQGEDERLWKSIAEYQGSARAREQLRGRIRVVNEALRATLDATPVERCVWTEGVWTYSASCRDRLKNGLPLGWAKDMHAMQAENEGMTKIIHPHDQPDPWAATVHTFWVQGSQRQWILKEAFDEVRAEVERQHAEEIARLKAAHAEEVAHKLAACEVAALSNTRESYARLNVTRLAQAWSPAFESVRSAVLRGIKLAETVQCLTTERDTARAQLTADADTIQAVREMYRDDIDEMAAALLHLRGRAADA